MELEVIILQISRQPLRVEGFIENNYFYFQSESENTELNLYKNKEDFKNELKFDFIMLSREIENTDECISQTIKNLYIDLKLNYDTKR